MIVTSALLFCVAPFAQQYRSNRGSGGTATDGKYFAEFGSLVAALGDVNADGISDLIVVATRASPMQKGPTAYVLSGRDGTLLFRFGGDAGFGCAVAGVGDLDGDHVPDFAIGDSEQDGDFEPRGSGRVVLCSGKSGKELATLRGEIEGDHFGAAVSGGFDLDGDGVSDVIVGATQMREAADTPPFEHKGRGKIEFCFGPGWVRAYSGATRKEIATWRGANPRDRFGASVLLVPDVDGDGCADVLIGAPGDGTKGPEVGAVRLYSGKTHALLVSAFGDAEHDFFGQRICALGDVNGDGVRDFAASATDEGLGDNAVRIKRSYVRIVSGKDGATIQTYFGERERDTFGFSIAAMPSSSGEKIDDLAIGDPEFVIRHSDGNSGRVVLGSTRHVAILRTYALDDKTCQCKGVEKLDEMFAHGPYGWGLSMSSSGDFDGDGAPDLLIGACDVFNPGRVYIYSSKTRELIRFFDEADLALQLTPPAKPKSPPQKE